MKIYTALLIEYKVFFYSINICTLTRTVMSFYSFFKPFRYPYCLIFSLPDNENYMPILDCPIPVSLGINSNLLP